MHTLFALVLAGATALMPHVEEQPNQRVTIGARVFFPGGKAAGSAQQRLTIGSGPATWYVFAGKTLCEGLTVSSEKPGVAGSGWRVDVKSAAQKAVQITWERLWVGGKPGSGGGTKTLASSTGSPAVLDSIDGGARLQHQANIDRLKSISPTDLAGLISIDALEDGETSKLKDELREQEKTRRALIEVEHLGPANTRVASIDSNIASTRKQLLDALNDNLAGLIKLQQMVVPRASVDGCDALSMNLNVTAETTDSTDPTETEVWLVHKDPAGVETVQRQIVRSAGGNGSFVFDDLVISTSRGPLTLEVNGGVRVLLGHGEGGQAWLVLDVNRRYVSSGTAFGWKTKEGGTGFTQTIRPDEVLAFNLLPLKDDEGVLVGHRFSVRVRMKILK